MTDTPPPRVLPSPPHEARSGITAGGCLRILGWIAVIAVVVVIGGFVLLYWSITSSYRKPQAYQVPVAQEQRTVSLSSDRPLSAGRLVIRANGSPSTATVGVTAGVPSRAAGPAAGQDPTDLLVAPDVRVTLALADGRTFSCQAPCELSAPTKFDCAAHPCELAGDLRIDLRLAGSDKPAPVTVPIAAGMTGGPNLRLPDGTTVQLDLDGAVTPEAS